MHLAVSLLQALCWQDRLLCHEYSSIQNAGFRCGRMYHSLFFIRCMRRLHANVHLSAVSVPFLLYNYAALTIRVLTSRLVNSPGGRVIMRRCSGIYLASPARTAPGFESAAAQRQTQVAP